MDIRYWHSDQATRAALQRLADYHPTLETAMTIQQIPAPTFDELRRSALVEERMRSLGLSDVVCDELGNVYGRRPGHSRNSGLLITAHLDTVFDLDTDLTIRHAGDRIYGPGLGDNSVGVAGMLHLAQLLQEYNLPNGGDIWFVGNVGEEGLGDLCGMRAVVDRLAPRIGGVIALEGCDFGTLHHQAIGVRRYRIDVHAPGGHSWGDFGSPSAIHTLVRVAARLTEIRVPSNPRTSINLGVISGGTAVNTIAQHASLLLDMRSVDVGALNALAAQVDELLARAASEHRDVRIESTTVGDRPAGAIPRDHPLVRTAIAAFAAFGASISYQQGSTDANVPLSRGIPAICVGLTDGGNAHRNDEYICPANLGRGMQALLLLTMAASYGA